MALRKASSCSARSACSKRLRLSALASCAAAAAAAWCAFASSRSLCGRAPNVVWQHVQQVRSGRDHPVLSAGLGAT